VQNVTPTVASNDEIMTGTGKTNVQENQLQFSLFTASMNFN